MPYNDKSETPIFQRIFDIGANKEFSITENSYLRITNIASILGILFMVRCMIAALYLTNTLILYRSNGLLALMFSFVLIFNGKGWRVLAST
jgi:adenylate cyclase